MKRRTKSMSYIAVYVFLATALLVSSAPSTSVDNNAYGNVTEHVPRGKTTFEPKFEA